MFQLRVHNLFEPMPLLTFIQSYIYRQDTVFFLCSLWSRLINSF